jgi:hypothetical protein
MTGAMTSAKLIGEPINGMEPDRGNLASNQIRNWRITIAFGAFTHLNAKSWSFSFGEGAIFKWLSYFARGVSCPEEPISNSPFPSHSTDSVLSFSL